MKKLLVISIVTGCFLFAATAMAGMKYECWTYVNGHPQKMINRTASSNSEATIMAQDWFKKNGYKFDYVKCK